MYYKDSLAAILTYLPLLDNINNALTSIDTNINTMTNTLGNVADNVAAGTSSAASMLDILQNNSDPIAVDQV